MSLIMMYMYYVCILTFQGLYYSYFKTMVEAETSFKGLQNLYANNITEYPDTINVLERFNVYPELFLGLTYRFLGIFHLNAIYIQQKLSFLDYAWHASFSKITKID